MDVWNPQTIFIGSSRLTFVPMSDGQITMFVNHHSWHDGYGISSSKKWLVSLIANLSITIWSYHKSIIYIYICTYSWVVVYSSLIAMVMANHQFTSSHSPPPQAANWYSWVSRPERFETEKMSTENLNIEFFTMGNSAAESWDLEVTEQMGPP